MGEAMDEFQGSAGIQAGWRCLNSLLADQVTLCLYNKNSAVSLAAWNFEAHGLELGVGTD